MIAPWGRRIGALRFETDGAWKRQGTTVDGLAKELRLALAVSGGRRRLDGQRATGCRLPVGHQLAPAR